MIGISPLYGVMVTYHPDETVLENVRAVVAECGHLLVIDNGSDPQIQIRLANVPGVEVISLGNNLGVAAALNVGALRAVAHGCRWIATFDQDSRPQPGLISALLATAAQHPRAAVIASRIIERDAGARGYRWLRKHPRACWLFQRVGCEGGDLDSVTMAITSGSLLELETWKRLGEFDEDLFIDYVDIDYCLKAGRDGRTIAVSAGATLEHKLGFRQSGVFLGHEFRPTHHRAIRHYTIARNRVAIWRRHAAAVPHWALFDMCFAVYNAARVLAFESKKGLKLKAMMLGTWDGFGGRSGPCPEHRRAQLDA